MLVYLALAYRRNESSGRCDPSFATLAQDCQLNERSVQRTIKTLRDRGLIMVKDSGFGNRYYRHRFQYGLIIPTPDAKSTVETLKRTESPIHSGQLVPLPLAQSPSTPDTES
jgi:Helix-turn-helix domain